MRRILLLSILSLALPACHQATAPPAESHADADRAFDGLLGLIRDRLGVMHDVARWKWARHAAIEDPDREAALLKDVADKGSALGLDPEMTRAFFRGQIEAAKVVQRADFRRWEEDGRGPEGEVPDLAGVLRPRIDALNRDLLAALASAKPRLRGRDSALRLRDRAGRVLVGRGIDAGVRETAIGPLTMSAR